jgi:hypothetical protein
LPRTYLFRSLVIMVVLLAADLADGESVFTEGALVLSLVVANCWLAGNIIGWCSPLQPDERRLSIP